LTFFPATDVALEGFRLTRENPRAVAVWAGIRAAYALLVLAVLNRFAGDEMTAFLAAMRHVQSLTELSAKAAPLAPIFLALSPLDLALQAILSAACFRTVLGPKAPERFQLALGQDELRLFALNIVTVVALLLAASIASMVGGVVGGVGAAVGPLGALLQAVYGATVVCGGIYVALRLSLAPALTFATGRFAILESWKATQGRDAPLAGAYVMAAGLAGLVYVLSVVIGQSTEAFDPTAASSWTSWGALVSAAWMAAVGQAISVIVTAPGAVASRLLATRAVDRA
jgi:hypothetical protein